jgi:hypothetical protein
MIPRLVRRRSDGLVEIRPVRARDVVPASDAAVLLALLAGWLLLAAILVMSLVFDPPFLGLAAWFVLFAAVEQRRARHPRLVQAHATPPPRSAS